MPFAFELGREFKLSIAEISKVFCNGNIIFCDRKVLVLDGVKKDEILSKAKKIGGTIKIMEVSEISDDIKKIFENSINLNLHKGKFDYAINVFGNSKIQLREILKTSKEIIKKQGKNPRFINSNFRNVPSIAIIKEALVKKETDFNFIFTPKKTYFGKTIFVQDVYGYSNRDWLKDKDIKIGMIPPKLAQIMINISSGKTIYDPFVGTGTILMESIYMGNKKVFGSDLSRKMIKATKNNLENLKKRFSFGYTVVFQDARNIHKVSFLSEVDAIVTEGCLGEIMTRKNISVERIERQKRKLQKLYKDFFSNLAKAKFRGNIVISFPFWKINGKNFYFEEVYDTIKTYCKVEKLLPKNIIFKETKRGSLLYKRNSQLVGREIFCLKLK